MVVTLSETLICVRAAICHITNVLVYNNGQVLVCCRIHLSFYFLSPGGGVVRGS